MLPRGFAQLAEIVLVQSFWEDLCQNSSETEGEHLGDKN